MDLRKVIFLLGLTPLCALSEIQAPDVKSGVEHLRKLDSMFLQDESVVVKSGTSNDQVLKPEAVNDKKNNSHLDLDSLKQGSLKHSEPVLESAQAASDKDPDPKPEPLNKSNEPEKIATSSESPKTPEADSVNIPAPPEIKVERVKSSETTDLPKADPKKMIADAKSGMGSSEHKREVKVTAAPEKKKVLLIAKKSVRKQSVKPKAAAVASSGGTLRDQNGAVDRVHNGLDDVTAADLAASKTLQPSLPKSPWEDEVREIASYNANRPPLPDGRSNPSISALSAEFGDRVPTSPRRPVTPRRNYDLSRKMTVFSRKDSFNVATQAPSQNEINEKRLLETAPRSGSARIPDVSGLVRN